MLHVTNGDSAGAVLRAAGFEGDVLCWRDVLHEGPVPDVPDETLRRLRARFLSESADGSEERVLRDLSERDARLEGAAGQEDLVLWFEHDLYDQLQLLQILAQLSAAGADWSRVSLICGAEYLGPSTPARLRERFRERAPVGPETVDVARRAWAAFRAPDPTPLVTLLGDGPAALPFAGPALRRHLQQCPLTFNGLSRSEHQALEAIAAGANRDSPLVTTIDGANPFDAPIELTPAGEAVLRGEADRVEERDRSMAGWRAPRRTRCLAMGRSAACLITPNGLHCHAALRVQRTNRRSGDQEHFFFAVTLASLVRKVTGKPKSPPFLLLSCSKTRLQCDGGSH